MTADPLRIERQTSDAAKRLAKTTGVGAGAFTVVDHGGGQTGMGFAFDGLNLLEVEFACFMILSKIAEERMPGSAEGCEGCLDAWSRTSAAIEALRPGFGPGWTDEGAC